MTTPSSTLAVATQFLQSGEQRYAYRRFGEGAGLPLLFLQHFTGTLDNWDSAVTDPLASGREVILFENAGVGRSTGTVSSTVADMAKHVLAFLDAMGLTRCDVLGYRTVVRTCRRKGPDSRVSRLGAVDGRAFRHFERDPSTDPRRERRPGRDDSSPQLVLAEREPAQRRPAHLSGLRARCLVSVSRVLYATRDGIPWF